MSDEKRLEGSDLGIGGDGAGEHALDRRNMLTAIGVGAAGLIATMMPSVAVAATSDPALAGTRADASNADPGLWGRNNNASPAGGVGVLGESLTGDGVVGHSNGNGHSGVWGNSYGTDGTGVTGVGSAQGVYGIAMAGNGVSGLSAASAKSGVYGTNFNAAGCGVLGETAGGVGVGAKATTGTALHVEGKASFSRSGVATVANSKTYKTITVPSGVATTAKFLVTLQGNAGSGVGVAYAARTGATTFRVYFTKKTTRAAHVGWMVLD